MNTRIGEHTYRRKKNNEAKEVVSSSPRPHLPAFQFELIEMSVNKSKHIKKQKN